MFTPSRRVAGKRVVCNDDWFIVKLAYESDGVIVSNDMYRDLHGKEPEWKRFIEERLLMYSFVNDKSVVRASVPSVSRQCCVCVDPCLTVILTQVHASR